MRQLHGARLSMTLDHITTRLYWWAFRIEDESLRQLGLPCGFTFRGAIRDRFDRG